MEASPEPKWFEHSTAEGTLPTRGQRPDQDLGGHDRTEREPWEHEAVEGAEFLTERVLSKPADVYAGIDQVHRAAVLGASGEGISEPPFPHQRVEAPIDLRLKGHEILGQSQGALDSLGFRVSSKQGFHAIDATLIDVDVLPPPPGGWHGFAHLECTCLYR